MARSVCTASWKPAPVRATRCRCGEPRLLDRRRWILFEGAPKPARRYPRMPARVFAGDQQRELERVSRLSCGSSRAAAKAATTSLR